MKRHLLFPALLLVSLMPLAGQGVFDTGKEVFRGRGSDQSSKPFAMTGPFVLSWTLIDQPPATEEERKYRTPYSEQHPAWIAIRVIDSKTGDIVQRISLTGMKGSQGVTQGGSFYLLATSYNRVDWIIRAKDGKLVKGVNGDSIVPVTAAELRGEGKSAEAVSLPPATEPGPTQPPAPPSNWDGKGLPPGMRKK